MTPAKACVCMSEYDGSISIVRICHRRWTDKEDVQKGSPSMQMLIK